MCPPTIRGPAAVVCPVNSARALLEVPTEGQFEGPAARVPARSRQSGRADRPGQGRRSRQARWIAGSSPPNQRSEPAIAVHTQRRSASLRSHERDTRSSRGVVAHAPNGTGQLVGLASPPNPPVILIIDGDWTPCALVFRDLAQSFSLPIAKRLPRRPPARRHLAASDARARRYVRSRRASARLSCTTSCRRCQAAWPLSLSPRLTANCRSWPRTATRARSSSIFEFRQAAELSEPFTFRGCRCSYRT